MIKFKRIPLKSINSNLYKEFLNNSKVIEQEIREFDLGSQKRFKTTVNLDLLGSQREKLYDIFLRKCAYCEARDSNLEIDFFRPVSGIFSNSKKAYPFHYAWLKFEWNNLYICCRNCNRHKKSLFPVKGERASLFTNHENLVSEDRLILDPCDTKELTCDHIRFLSDGECVALTEKGQATIDSIGLNRSELVYYRASELHKIKEELELYRQRNVIVNITNSFEASTIFAEAKRQYAAELMGYNKAWISEKWYQEICDSHNKNIASKSALFDPLEVFIAKNEGAYDSNVMQSPKYLSSPPYIRSIRIKNIGPVKNMTVEFNRCEDDSERWAMLLGENGAGKSSLLQAVAIACLWNDERKFELTEELKKIVSVGARSSEIEVNYENGYEPIVIKWSAGRGAKVNIKPPEIIFLSFGSTRLISRIEDGSSFNAFENLFDPYKTLCHPNMIISDWKKSLGRKEFKLLFNLFSISVKEMLEMAVETVFIYNSKGLSIKSGEKVIPFDRASEGYNSIIGLVINIFEQGRRYGFYRPEDIVGVVILDELGTHLHPRWRIRITGALRKTFKNIQFICSTHEPLCLRGLKNGEVFKIYQSNDSGSAILKDLPNIEGLKSEQLLTSNHFGLLTTIDEDLNNEFEEYYELLRQKNQGKILSAEENERMSEIHQHIASIDAKDGILGNSRRDMMIYKAVDMVLAMERERINGAKIDIESELRLRLKNILNESA